MDCIKTRGKQDICTSEKDSFHPYCVSSSTFMGKSVCVSTQWQGRVYCDQMKNKRVESNGNSNSVPTWY